MASMCARGVAQYTIAGLESQIEPFVASSLASITIVPEVVTFLTSMPCSCTLSSEAITQADHAAEDLPIRAPHHSSRGRDRSS